MIQEDFLKRIGLLAHLTAGQLEEIKKASQTSGRRVEAVARDDFNVEEPVILAAKAAILDLPLAKVPPEGVNPEALQFIPQEIINHYEIAPLNKRGEVLEVGLVNPESIDAEEALDFIATSRGVKVTKFLLSPSDFARIKQQLSNAKIEVKEALESLGDKFTAQAEKTAQEDDEPRVRGGTVELAEQAPISKVVKVILRYAVESKASDIHIEPVKDQVKVRFRLDGSLHNSLFLPKSILPAIISRIKILSTMKIDETRIPQDGRIHTSVLGHDVDFRVSTFPTTEGEKVVLRVLDTSKGTPTFEELGLQGKALEDLELAMAAPFGATLITGPTGSGKSTTLYAVLGRLNQEDVNIVTLEDPVEYYMTGVSQSQIRPEIGYSFGSGLRHILRQDPDIIMVGEIRDEETAGLAVHAALTGHLVFSTLHTNDTMGVIPRLVDMGVQPFLLSASLKLAVAQRLVGRICPNCKEEYRPEPSVVQFLEKALEGVPEKYLIPGVKQPFKLWRAKGCAECGHRGSRGRIGIYETLYITPDLQKLMTKSLIESEIKNLARRQGLVDMRQDGILKAIQGYVTLEEVVKATEEPEKIEDHKKGPKGAVVESIIGE